MCLAFSAAPMWHYHCSRSCCRLCPCAGRRPHHCRQLFASDGRCLCAGADVSGCAPCPHSALATAVSHMPRCHTYDRVNNAKYCNPAIMSPQPVLHSWAVLCWQCCVAMVMLTRTPDGLPPPQRLPCQRCAMHSTSVSHGFTHTAAAHGCAHTAPRACGCRPNQPLCLHLTW